MAVSPGGRPMDTSPFSSSTTDNWVARAGGLPEYIRGVAHALLRTGRAKDESAAIRLAVGAIQNWASGRTTNGKGHVHPAVQAAAAAALAEWEAKRAKAHSHTAEGGAFVELAGAWNSALHPRIPAGGAGGGQFGTAAAGASKTAPAKGKPAAGQAKPAPKKPPPKKAPAKPAARPPVSPAQLQANRAKAAKLHAQAKADRAKAKALLGQVSQINAQITANQAAAAKAAKAAKAKAKNATAKASTNAPAKHAKASSKPGGKKKAAKRMTTAQLKTKRASLRAQAAGLMARAKALDAQASHLKLANDGAAVELAVKTPVPERAAGRKKLAAKGQALPAEGGKPPSFPIPNVDYLRRAIRSVGRAPASKRPALKNLIRKRARELKATNAPGVKGTWAFQAANDSDGIELAMTMKTPRVRGPGDVSVKRTAPDEVTVTHKPTGMRIGTLKPAQHGGWSGTHATGKPSPASGSMAGALSGLIGVHNKVAASAPSAEPAGGVRAMAAHEAAMELAGALPYTSAATSSDGPRVTTMGGGKKAAPSELAPAAHAVYRKLRAKGMKHGQALALAARAASMRAKTTAKAA